MMRRAPVEKEIRGKEVDVVVNHILLMRVRKTTMTYDLLRPNSNVW